MGMINISGGGNANTLQFSGTFNSTTGVTLTHNIGNTNYRVLVTPTSNSNGYLGEIYVTKAVNTVTVFCTGSSTTTTFDCILFIG